MIAFVDKNAAMLIVEIKMNIYWVNKTFKLFPPNVISNNTMTW